MHCLCLDYILGPDYMKRAGPVSQATSVCRDDFQLGYYMRRASPVDDWCDKPRKRPGRAWFWREEGYMSRADPANAITWQKLGPISRDPGTAFPGSRLTGLARLSCNRKVVFLLRLTNVPRFWQTDATPVSSTGKSESLPIKFNIAVKELQIK